MGAFQPYVQIIQIILSIALVAVILAQAKGQGGLGGIFGGDSTVYRTRRGVERTLFNVTVGLAVAFFFLAGDFFFAGGLRFGFSASGSGCGLACGCPQSLTGYGMCSLR